MNEFEVIEHLQGLASASEDTGVPNELQSVWKEWDLVLDEATGDKPGHKRSAQLTLARMDFKRQKLYVLFVRHFRTASLTGARREYSMEYFFVGPNLVRSRLAFLNGLSADGHRRDSFHGTRMGHS